MSQNCNLFEGLFTLVTVLLYRYTSQEDYILGTQFKLDENRETSHTIALRLSVKNVCTFNGFLSKVQQQVHEAIIHQSYSFKNILRDLNLSDIPGRHSLFDVMVLMEDEIEELPKGLDLVFAFREYDGKLTLNIYYDLEIYEKETIERLGNHLAGLLKALILNASEVLNSLEYISVEEKNQLLSEFNNNKVDYPKNKSIITLFEEQAERTPDYISLVFGNIKLTYRELNEKANQLANCLREKFTLKPDDLIGIKLEKSELIIVSILGVMKTGAAYLPIDLDLPEERINFILKDSSCKVLINEQWLSEFSKDEAHYDKNNLGNFNTSEDLAYVIYTSGSTGNPKGVMINHRALVDYSYGIRTKTNIENCKSFGLVSTLAADLGNTLIYTSLLIGGELHILSGDDVKNPEKMFNYPLDCLKIVPSHWKALQEGNNLFVPAKCLIFGGEQLTIDIINHIKENKGLCEVYNHYGPSETTIGKLIKKINLEDINLKISLGFPFGNTSVYILDSFNHLKPKGIEGEICISGDGLARGYLNNPELTSQKFIDNPYTAGTLMYKTGDLGRWLPDGSIEFIGRVDFQVKIRGYRIELDEIESVIKSYPVIQNVVVLLNDKTSSDKHLIAYIVAKEEVNKSALREYLNNKLPAYMIPSFFHQLDHIPLTSNGKIDRMNLKNQTIKYTSDINLGDLPSTTEELLISKLWSEFLELDNISIHSDFFEVGGNSLIAIRFISRLNSLTGFKLPMALIFEHPTIEKIAFLLKNRNNTQQWKCLMPIKPNGNKTPLYIIHGGGLGVLYFNDVVKYLDENQPVYGLQALGMEGNDEPLYSVEEMAKYYISEMENQNPDGSYALAGLCMGGIIAFEMAKQLKSKAKNVKLLAIFDYNVEETRRQENSFKKFKRKLIHLPQKTIFDIQSRIKQPKKHFKTFIRRWELRYITMKIRFGIQHYETTHQDGLVNNINKAVEANRNAIKKYNLLPYEGKIDLFIPKDKMIYETDSTYLGWKPYALKGIETHIVNGDRDNFILSPLAESFAEELQKCLDN